MPLRAKCSVPFNGQVLSQIVRTPVQCPACLLLALWLGLWDTLCCQGAWCCPLRILLWNLTSPGVRQQAQCETSLTLIWARLDVSESHTAGLEMTRPRFLLHTRSNPLQLICAPCGDSYLNFLNINRSFLSACFFLYFVTVIFGCVRYFNGLANFFRLSF